MSETIKIPSSERGVVRVFSVDLEAGALHAFADEEDGEALAAALGAERFDRSKAEIFAVSDLSGLGLSSYLEEGQGVAPAELAGLRARLDAITGTVLVVPSSAFEGEAQTLTPRAPLRHVATLNEERPDMRVQPLPSEAAIGSGSPGGAPLPPHRNAVSRLVAYALIAAAVVIGLAILIMVLA